MQPIRLKLENFGPYEDSLIDFSDFYAQSLFLITGKTGAGKTTIFDGMTYALYGNTSGGLRQGKEMRSNFAEVGSKTCVTFTFKQENKTYEVVREPEQLVKKLRGEGFREQPATVRLTVFDENNNEIEQLTKQKDVGPFLSELIQLNESQFSQIVMLPQGEFRRFLNADSDSKEKVLRKLFNTYFYQDIADSLRAQKKGQEALLKDEHQALNLLVGQIEWQDDFKEKQTDNMYYQDLLTLYEDQEKAYQEEEKTQLDVISKEKIELLKQDELIQAEKKWLAYFKELESARKKQNDLSKKEVNILEDKRRVALLKEVEKIKPTYEYLLTLEKEHDSLLIKEKELRFEEETLSVKLKKNQEILAERSASEAEIEKDKQELINIETSLPLFKRKETLGEEQKNLKEELELLLTLQKKLVLEQDSINQRLVAGKNILAKKPKVIETKFQLVKAVEDNQIRLVEIKKYQKNKLALEEITLQLEDVQKQVLKTREQKEIKLSEQKQVKSDWAKAQIAKLSLELVEGEMCPVCGSLEHPSPTHVEVMTKEEMILLEEKVETIETELAQISETIVSLDKTKEFKESEKETFEKELEDLRNRINLLFEKEVSEADWLLRNQEETDELVIKRQHNDAELNQIEEQVTLVEEAENRQKEVSEQLNQMQEKIRELENKNLQVTVSYKEISERLPKKWSTLKEMLEESETLSSKVEKWEKEVATLKNDINKLEQQQLVTKTTLKNELEQKNVLENKLIQEQKKVDLFKETQEFSMSDLNELITQVEQLTTLEEDIQTFEKELYALKEEMTKLDHLLDGREKPELEPLMLVRDTLNNSLEKNQERLNTLQYRMNQNKKIILQVREKELSIKEQLEALEELTELANVMTGDGPNKLSMERFVLQTYLKRILKRGNEKLTLLTNGRYQFELKEEQGSFKKKTGLEINIFDDNTGTLRGVNTLSGGESFIAALSLALSLAEVIQEEAGGIKIEAMFIDEGFGSLDEDALEMAIRALESIEGEGRLIGIISHVRELKERIPQQLQIKSTLDGKSYVTERLEFE